MSWELIVGLSGWVLLLALALWAYRAWRQKTDLDDRNATLFDLIERMLDALQEATKERLRDIPQAEVESAAQELYRRYIAGSPLAVLVGEIEFIRLAVAEWKRLVGVDQAVALGVTRYAAARKT